MRTTRGATCPCIAMAWILFAYAAWGADWPQFQGPHRNGLSKETGLLQTWPEAGAPVMWSVEVGPGFGGVAIQAGEVYLLDRVVGKEDLLRCFDLETGQERWTFSYEAPGRLQYPGSRSHPLIHGEFVYILGPFGHMHCLDRKNHTVEWKRNPFEEYSGKIPHWGSSQCPVIYKDTIIVAPMGTQAGIVAYHKDTGEPVWQSEPLTNEGKFGAYGSPMISTILGMDQVLITTPTETAGLNADTGEFLWRTQDWQCSIPIISPCHLGDGKVFISGGYQAGAALFQISRDGESFRCEILFKTDVCQGQIHQPILHEDHLYMNGNDKTKMHGMICLDLQGNLKWKTHRKPGFDWGGLLWADGLIYVIDGDTGELCIVEPHPEAYTEISRMPLLHGKEIWGTLALSEGRLLCRDQSHLVCVNIRK